MEAFEAAKLIVQQPDFPSRVTEGELLYLYALYKRATCGVASSVPMPPAFHPRARKKWNAWKAHDSKTPDDCRAEYTALVARLQPTDDA